LKAAGFGSNDISVLLHSKEGSREFAVENQSKAPEGAAVGASAGALLGGGLGWLAGIGMLAIPGVGPFIAAGPIMAALSGVAVGTAVGGVTGALVGLGIPEHEASHYEDRLRSGRCLVSVHADEYAEVERAKSIFQESGAEDIAITGEPASTIR
jgi:hypothetical protein